MLAGFMRRRGRLASTKISSAISATVIPIAAAAATGPINRPVLRMIFTACRRVILRRPSVSAILTRIGATIRVIEVPTARAVPATIPPLPMPSVLAIATCGTGPTATGALISVTPAGLVGGGKRFKPSDELNFPKLPSPEVSPPKSPPMFSTRPVMVLKRPMLDFLLKKRRVRCDRMRPYRR